MAYSSNGISWQEIDVITSIFTRYGVARDIAYGGGKFVVVGNNGQTTGTIVYSNDGTNWEEITETTFGTGELRIYGVAYGAGKFVAVGANGKMAYSNTLE
jgi:hypothetical protein